MSPFLLIPSQPTAAQLGSVRHLTPPAAGGNFYDGPAGRGVGSPDLDPQIGAGIDRPVEAAVHGRQEMRPRRSGAELTSFEPSPSVAPSHEHHTGALGGLQARRAGKRNLVPAERAGQAGFLHDDPEWTKIFQSTNLADFLASSGEFVGNFLWHGWFWPVFAVLLGVLRRLKCGG